MLLLAVNNCRGQCAIALPCCVEKETSDEMFRSVRTRRQLEHISPSEHGETIGTEESVRIKELSFIQSRLLSDGRETYYLLGSVGLARTGLLLLGPISLVVSSSSGSLSIVTSVEVIIGCLLIFDTCLVELRWILAYWREKLSSEICRKAHLGERKYYRVVHQNLLRLFERHRNMTLILFNLVLAPVLLVFFTVLMQDPFVQETSFIYLGLLPVVFLFLTGLFVCKRFCIAESALLTNTATRSLIPIYGATLYSLLVAGSSSLLSFAEGRGNLGLLLAGLTVAIPLLGRLFTESSRLEINFSASNSSRRSKTFLKRGSVVSQVQSILEPDISIGQYLEKSLEMPIKKVSRLYRNPVENVFIDSVMKTSTVVSTGNNLANIRSLYPKKADYRFLQTAFALCDLLREELNLDAAEHILDEINHNRYVYIRSQNKKLVFVEKSARLKEEIGRPATAVKFFEESIQLYEKLFGGSHLGVVVALTRLGISLTDQVCCLRTS